MSGEHGAERAVSGRARGGSSHRGRAGLRKYGKQSEKLSDLQLQLLDLEPAVSSDEIETEIASGPLSEEQTASSAAQQQKKRKPHPGCKELPLHLKRIEEIVACAAEQCMCGKCGRETEVIGYEETEVLGMKPAVHFVHVIKREKGVCKSCIEHGVVTALVRTCIAPKSIFAEETIVEFIVRKYCDALLLYRQRAILMRDLGIDVALTTINDAVLRVGELLIPVVDTMKRDLLAGGYIQADETHVGVHTPDKKGENHKAHFWQYSAPMKGVVFDFAIGRKNWLHLGSQEAGLKIAAIFSIVESYRKLGILIRKYLADTLPVSLIAPSTSWMT